MKSWIWIIWCALAAVHVMHQDAWPGWNVSRADVDGDGAADLTVENALLKATVGGCGGELQSLQDLLPDVRTGVPVVRHLPVRTFTPWRELEWCKDWWADDGVGKSSTGGGRYPVRAQ